MEIRLTNWTFIIIQSEIFFFKITILRVGYFPIDPINKKQEN